MNYFEQASNFANEGYSNYDGGQGWSNLVGADTYSYADASASAPVDYRSSLPYIISISNSTTSDVSSVVILNANNPGTSPNFNNNAAITITYSSGSITYAEFLKNIQSEPFTVGMINLYSSNASQILQNFTITNKEVNGIVNTIPVTPILDPYQNITTTLNIEVPFVVNSFTSITFATILGSASLTVKLYPKNQTNLARTLEGRQAVKGYAKPGISQLQVPTSRPLVG